VRAGAGRARACPSGVRGREGEVVGVDRGGCKVLCSLVVCVGDGWLRSRIRVMNRHEGGRFGVERLVVTSMTEPETKLDGNFTRPDHHLVIIALSTTLHPTPPDLYFSLVVGTCHAHRSAQRVPSHAASPVHHLIPLRLCAKWSSRSKISRRSAQHMRLTPLLHPNHRARRVPP
jgi:hypothetical protein